MRRYLHLAFFVLVFWCRPAYANLCSEGYTWCSDAIRCEANIENGSPCSPPQCSEGSFWCSTSNNCVADGGVCVGDCPEGTMKQGGNCEDITPNNCSEGERYSPQSNSCVAGCLTGESEQFCGGCPTSQVWSAVESACVPDDTCPDDMHIDPGTSTCVDDSVSCGQNMILENGECVSNGGCGDGRFRNSAGTCEDVPECTEGMAFSYQYGQCIEGDPSTCEGNTPGFDPNTGQCFGCSQEGTHFDSVSNQCVPDSICDAGQVMVDGECQAIMDCPAGNYWVSSDNSCAPFEDECVSPATYDPVKNECTISQEVCGTLEDTMWHEESGTCISTYCGVGRVFDTETYTCVDAPCPDGQSRSNDTGECENTCPEGQSFDTDSGACAPDDGGDSSSSSTSSGSSSGDTSTSTSSGDTSTSTSSGNNKDQTSSTSTSSGETTTSTSSGDTSTSTSSSGSSTSTSSGDLTSTSSGSSSGSGSGSSSGSGSGGNPPVPELSLFTLPALLGVGGYMAMRARRRAKDE